MACDAEAGESRIKTPALSEFEAPPDNLAEMLSQNRKFTERRAVDIAH